MHTGDCGSMCEVSRKSLENQTGMSLSDAKHHQSTTEVAKIATTTTWLKLLDLALDHGVQGTAFLQTLFRILTHPTVGSKPCHLCEIDVQQVAYSEHYISQHSSLTVSLDVIIKKLSDGDTNLFMYAKQFSYVPL